MSSWSSSDGVMNREARCDIGGARKMMNRKLSVQRQKDEAQPLMSDNADSLPRRECLLQGSTSQAQRDAELPTTAPVSWARSSSDRAIYEHTSVATDKLRDSSCKRWRAPYSKSIAFALVLYAPSPCGDARILAQDHPTRKKSDRIRQKTVEIRGKGPRWRVLSECERESAS